MRVRSRLLAVDLAGALVGEAWRGCQSIGRPAPATISSAFGGQHMAVDVDREPFAAGMRRTRKAARDLRPVGRHLNSIVNCPPPQCLSVPVTP